MEWVTVNGRHIPVDDEESRKKRQIDFNKQEAAKRNSGSSKGKKPGLSKLDKLNNKKSKGEKK